MSSPVAALPPPPPPAAPTEGVMTAGSEEDRVAGEGDTASTVETEQSSLIHIIGWNAEGIPKSRNSKAGSRRSKQTWWLFKTPSSPPRLLSGSRDSSPLSLPEECAAD